MLALRCLLPALVTSLAFPAASADAQSSGMERRRAVRSPDTGLEIYALAGYDPALATTGDLER